MAIASCECGIGRAKGRRRLMSVPVIGGGWRPMVDAAHAHADNDGGDHDPHANCGW
jgi:hypothetical protein